MLPNLEPQVPPPLWTAATATSPPHCKQQPHSRPAQHPAQHLCQTSPQSSPPKTWPLRSKNPYSFQLSGEPWASIDMYKNNSKSQTESDCYQDAVLTDNSIAPVARNYATCCATCCALLRNCRLGCSSRSSRCVPPLLELSCQQWLWSLAPKYCQVWTPV